MFDCLYSPFPIPPKCIWMGIGTLQASLFWLFPCYWLLVLCGLVMYTTISVHGVHMYVYIWRLDRHWLTSLYGSLIASKDINSNYMHIMSNYLIIIPVILPTVQVTPKHTSTPCIKLWLGINWHCELVHGCMVSTQHALRVRPQQFHVAPAM